MIYKSSYFVGYFHWTRKKNFFFSSQIFLTSQFNHYLCEAKCFVENSFNVYIFSGDGMICFFSFSWMKYIEMSQLRHQEAIIFNPLNFIILQNLQTLVKASSHSLQNLSLFLNIVNPKTKNPTASFNPASNNSSQLIIIKRKQLTV